MEQQRKKEDLMKESNKIIGKKESGINLIISKKLIHNIFSLINKKTKLYLIMYNKKFQKLFGINIEIYKEISGKYLIKDKNGNDKVYTLDTKRLLFEGKYLNGKKNGIGKDFDFMGDIIFEGQYIDGIRNGYGKIYNFKHEVVFEGEFLKGVKWNGIGKEYGLNYELLYDGEYKNGKGKSYYEKENIKLKFEFEYLGPQKIKS